VDNTGMSYRELCEALLNREPYAGSALRALQGDPERQRYFLPVVKAASEFLSSPLHILEIGSWAGVSTISWGVALKHLQLEGAITCVDPWVPYFDTTINSTDVYREMNESAGTNLIYKLFEHNIASAGLHNVVNVKKATSREVLPELPAATWAIIYIDGSHTYEDVTFDIRQAKRLLRDGGILCGDDLELESAQLDPSELGDAVRTGQDFVLSRSTQRYYHPGVTAAVAEAIGKVYVRDGFWAVRVFSDRYVQVELDLESATVPSHISKFITNIPQLLDDSSPPRIVDVHLGFNIVRFQNKMYGLRQAIGEVDVTSGEDALRNRYSHRDLLIGTSVDEIKTRIDILELAQEMMLQMSILQSEVKEELTELRRRAEQIAVVHKDLQAKTDRLHEAVNAANQRLGQVESDVAKIFHSRIWRILVRMGGLINAVIGTNSNEADKSRGYSKP
jgi:predicted O-methyltransferase YrrM